MAGNVTSVTRDGGSGEAETPADGPLTAAERMRRMRQRRKAEREEASRQAAELGHRPAFRPGNVLALEHGIYSARSLTPRAEEILLRERAKPTWPAYLEEPVYERAVRAWSRAEAMLELYTEYVEQQTAEVMSTEFGEAEEDITGDGEKGGNSTRRSRTRKTGPSLELWRKLDAAASMHRTKLGLDPLARARLGKDIASSQADMARIMADMDREERSAS